MTNKRQIFEICLLNLIGEEQMPYISEKTDPRIIKTKKAIHEVFKKMVCEMPFEKITIKAITESARINRNTFYLHYDCVDDVLADIQSGYVAKFSQLIDGLTYTRNAGELVRHFYEFMESQDEFFKIITCDSRFDYIRERMQNRVTAKTYANSKDLHSKNEAIQNIVRAFHGVTLYLYRQWVADGKKIPMEEAIALSTTLLESGMNGYIGKK